MAQVSQSPSSRQLAREGPDTSSLPAPEAPAHQLAALADNGAALGVAQDDPADAKVDQQLGRDLACVRADAARPAVLRRDLVRRLQGLLHLRFTASATERAHHTAEVTLCCNLDRGMGHVCDGPST